MTAFSTASCFSHKRQKEGFSKNERYEIRKVVFRHSFDTYGNPEYRGQSDGDIVTVLKDWETQEIVMSDSVMEKRTNLDVLDEAHGDILIGGIGMGMILLELQDMEKVNSITVVEIDKELSDFTCEGLKDQLDMGKITIINQDIFKLNIDKKFNFIYIDIWNNIEGGNYRQMKQLKSYLKKYRHKPLRENPIMMWREKGCRRLAR